MMDKQTSGGCLMMLWCAAIITTALFLWRMWGAR
jgi:hypothetical protein